MSRRAVRPGRCGPPGPGYRAAMSPSLPVTGKPEVDRFLVDDPLALMIGMLLDQQVQ